MKRLIAFTGLLLACLVVSGAAPDSMPAKMLAHDVYFTLKDDSQAAKDALVKACKKYLSDHPGTVWFDAAVRVQENNRAVNDRDFAVALHLLFKDKASHDLYQKAPKHLKFIEENQANWEEVRVFDSWVVSTAHTSSE